MFFPVMTSTELLKVTHRRSFPFGGTPVIIVIRLFFVLKAIVFQWNHFKKPPQIVLWNLQWGMGTKPPNSGNIGNGDHGIYGLGFTT